MAVWLSFTILCLMSPRAFGWTVGPPLCSKNSDTNMLRSQFNIRLAEGDVLDDVFGCIVNLTNSGLLERAPCSISENETVVEDGNNVTYFTINSMVNLNDVSDTENGCGITETTFQGQRAFQMIIALRQSAGFIKLGDANYMWHCIELSATNTFVTTNVDVLSPDLDVNLEPVLPGLRLEVLKEDSSASDGFSVATTCNIGEDLILQVVMDRPLPLSDFLTPWGVFMYNTVYGPDSSSILSSGNSYQLIGNDGCIQSNSLDFGSSFVRDSSSTEAQAVYRTGVGKCYRFGTNSDELWFATYVDFCSGVYEEDERCIEYCPVTARRKRSDTPGPQTLYVKVKIEEPQAIEKEKKSLEPWLIGLAGGLSVLLVFVIAIAVYVFCARERKSTTSRSRFSNSSLSSSTSSIPAKF